jgi:SAM-dependent methyltransferase
MPTVDWNYAKWNERHDWSEEGDEWSIGWGGPRAQWLTCVFPRLAPMLPTGSLLEIATGHGRWTGFLLPECTSYIGVDLAPNCVDTCRKRFADDTHATFAVTDGMTLPMVPDESTDLVFSFDSLVHVESDVIASYLREFQRILSTDGVAFIHHSNVGIYHRTARWRDLSAKFANPFWLTRGVLRRVGWAEWHGDRGRSMTAQRFAELANEAGLACPRQEVIGWSGLMLTDCISVVTRPGSKWDRTPTVVRNRHFKSAQRSTRLMAQAFLP